MELMIQIPWLTRMRRLAISLALVLVLVAVALPASAAAPEGIEGEVTVVNGADQPVPITGEVTSDVTGSVDIDGTVATTQSGAWTVGLDAAAVGHLSGIDDATAPLTYDASGNLNVNVAAESLPASAVQTASELTGNRLFVEVLPTDFVSVLLGTDSRVTAFSFYASESVEVRFTNLVGSSLAETPVFFRLDAGVTHTVTFPFPFVADSLQITNLHDVHRAHVWLSVNGY